MVLAFCAGASIVARTGLTENIAVTTHHGAFNELRTVAPNTEIREGDRVVDSGKIVFSGGISAGIDAAFYLVAKLLGRDAALETASYMEYDWQKVANV